MNNKKKYEKGTSGGGAIFLEESIVVLTDIKAILLTPGIFIMQICITNMY